MKCTCLYSINLYNWRRVSSTSASAFFRLRSLPACTPLPPALASHLDSPFAWTHLTPGLGSRLHLPFAWTRLPTRAHGSAFISARISPQVKSTTISRRHFSAHSSTSCMRHHRRRSSTHSEASSRRRNTLKRRISAHKSA